MSKWSLSATKRTASSWNLSSESPSLAWTLSGDQPWPSLTIWGQPCSSCLMKTRHIWSTLLLLQQIPFLTRYSPRSLPIHNPFALGSHSRATWTCLQDTSQACSSTSCSPTSLTRRPTTAKSASPQTNLALPRSRSTYWTWKCARVSRCQTGREDLSDCHSSTTLPLMHTAWGTSSTSWRTWPLRKVTRAYSWKTRSTSWHGWKSTGPTATTRTTLATTTEGTRMEMEATVEATTATKRIETGTEGRETTTTRVAEVAATTTITWTTTKATAQQAEVTRVTAATEATIRTINSITTTTIRWVATSSKCTSHASSSPCTTRTTSTVTTSSSHHSSTTVGTMPSRTTINPFLHLGSRCHYHSSSKLSINQRKWAGTTLQWEINQLQLDNQPTSITTDLITTTATTMVMDITEESKIWERNVMRREYEWQWKADYTIIQLHLSERKVIKFKGLAFKS